MADLRGRNEELDAFAHTVAHDLKNPVHVVVSYADLLTQAVDLADDERAHALQAIMHTGYKIGSIIDDLLLLARLRQSEVQTASLDKLPIVADSLTRLTYTIKAAQARIVWSRPRPGRPRWKKCGPTI